MCVIIIKQKKQKIDREILKRSAKVNPHGLGVIWLDSYELSYHKSDKYKILDASAQFQRATPQPCFSQKLKDCLSIHYSMMNFLSI